LGWRLKEISSPAARFSLQNMHENASTCARVERRLVQEEVFREILGLFL
jgi:hypothetical protein